MYLYKVFYNQKCWHATFPRFANVFPGNWVGSLAIDTVCKHIKTYLFLKVDQCDVLRVFLLLHSIVMFNENHWCENKLSSKFTNSSTLSTINHCYWTSTVENVLFTAMFGLQMKSSPHCRLSSIDVFFTAALWWLLHSVLATKGKAGTVLPIEMHYHIIITHDIQY